VASTQSNELRITAIVGSGLSPDTPWVSLIKNKVPVWSALTQWYTWQADNIVINSFAEATSALTRQLQTKSNLYLPESLYVDLSRPYGVHLYGGSYVEEVDNAEQIIAMHLTGATNDIILLLGFDLSEYDITDKYQSHKRKKYINYFLTVIAMHPNTQWVCVNHNGPLDSRLTSASNLLLDSSDNVLCML
jgi:hypothetical protein